MTTTLHSTDLEKDRCPACGAALSNPTAELARLRADNERLQARVGSLKSALIPFARYVELNDLKDRDPLGNLEVPISDLLYAHEAYRADIQHASTQAGGTPSVAPPRQGD